jgi:hypothetical protein
VTNENPSFLEKGGYSVFNLPVFKCDAFARYCARMKENLEMVQEPSSTTLLAAAPVLEEKLTLLTQIQLDLQTEQKASFLAIRADLAKLHSQSAAGGSEQRHVLAQHLRFIADQLEAGGPSETAGLLGSSAQNVAAAGAEPTISPPQQQQGVVTGTSDYNYRPRLHQLQESIMNTMEELQLHR